MNIVSKLKYIFLIIMLLQPVHAGTLPDFTTVVKAQSGIVVNISTTKKSKTLTYPGPKLDMPNMPEAFKHLFKQFEEVPKHEFGAHSLGSGFLISADGYIITNHHVIKDAAEITVRLTDRTEKMATVVGVDKSTDVAVLKIEGSGYSYAKIGEPEQLEVGEWVLAIGSPFGFDYSVTAGIVSAKGRSFHKQNYIPFIQTDVAINPGNSGGPLFNLKGEVVGVNSQIFSRTGGFMGLSFSIPIDVAMNVVGQIQDKGRVSRGWLGVMIQDVTRELAESFNMARPQGALVTKVLDDGPAKQAGFQVGDVILRYQGKTVERSAMLPPLVGVTAVNSRVEVEVLRQGKTQTLTVQIAELPGSDEVVPQASMKQPSVEQARLGLVLADLTDKQKRELSVDAGVSILRVKPGAAKHAGIARGDVILMLDGVTVKNLAHFQTLVAQLSAGRSVAVLVHKGEGPAFLALKMPE